MRAYINSIGDLDTMPPQMTSDETLIALTQAAITAAQGSHALEAVTELIVRLGTNPSLPTDYLAYFEVLRQTVAQPDKAQQDTLAEKATMFLSQSLGPSLRLTMGLNLAQVFDGYGRAELALPFQAQAVEALRAHTKTQPDADLLAELAVSLFNLALYQAQVEQFTEAVTSLEEVVAIDRQLGLPDLVEDEAALENMKRRRDGLPPLAAPTSEPLPSEAQAALEARIANLPPEEQAKIRQNVEQFMALSPAQQEAIVAAEEQSRIDAQADQLLDLAVAARLNRNLPDMLLMLDQSAADLAANHPPDSAGAKFGIFIRAMAALLRDEAVPAVAPEYRARMAALKQRLTA